MGETSVEESEDLALAVSTAKAYLKKAFAGESIENVELEEVRPPEVGTIWQITIGFNRRRPPNPHGMSLHLAGNAFVQAAAAASARPPRIYKVVEVDLEGPRGISITNWKDE